VVLWFRKEEGIVHAGLLLFMLATLGVVPLLDNNEGLYSAIARDMLRSGQWVIPHLNGVPYLEKPPLLFWLMAVVFRVCGEHVWSARLVPCLAAWGTGLWISWFLGRTMPDRDGAWSDRVLHAGITGTCLAAQVWGRIVLLDMLMTFWLAGSLMLFLMFATETTVSRRPGWIRGSWALLAGAVMTKGFVALVLWASITGIFMLFRRWPVSRWWCVFDPCGVGLFVVLVAPWHILASLQHPGFAFFYFVNEHVYRFLDMREPRDYYTGPWFYYLPRILLMLLPWSAGALVEGVRALCPPRAGWFRAPGHDLRAFVGAWVLGPLVFFSLSRAKANYYMLAALPALLVAGPVFLKPEGVRRVARTGLLVLMVVQAGVAVWSTQHPVLMVRDDLWTLCPGVAWGVLAAMITAFFALSFVWRTPLVSGLFFLGVMMPLSRNGSLVSSQPGAVALPREGTCLLYKDFEDLSALAFVHPQPWVILESESRDLLYGQNKGTAPHLFLSMDAFNRRRQADVVVMKKFRHPEFLARCMRPSRIRLETEKIIVIEIDQK
jgi:4-amino-4-deoxy-L-arabinose transferase-like glycosyltransferase